MSRTIYIEVYSDKSIVVRGDTKKEKDSLRNLGGKWGSSFTDKTTGEKFGAWLFPKFKKETVENWIENGCKPVVNKRTNYEYQNYSSYNSSTNDVKTSSLILDEIKQLSKQQKENRKLLGLICENLNISVVEDEEGETDDIIELYSTDEDTEEEREETENTTKSSNKNNSRLLGPESSRILRKTKNSRNSRKSRRTTK